MSAKHIRKHGELRGLAAVANSTTFEGRFGKIFRTLPKAFFPDDALSILASAMSAKKEGAPTPETEKDDEENSGISAGYTYFGQFIDHDITFDPASSLQKENDPDSVVDFRSPRLDLDNVYGRGPDDQPYMYENDGKKLRLGRKLTGNSEDQNTQDLQRINPEPKRAIIGDPRNDENVIVSQLQGIFIRFHNRMVDEFPEADFQTIQRLVRWHYQWIVVHDFLRTILDQKTFDEILPNVKKGTTIIEDKPEIKFYKWKKEPFIPVEFSVAAYRFGHSMVRPIYRLNTTLADRFDIFSQDPNTSLVGFREFPSQWAIDWKLYFDFGNKPNPLSKNRIQPAYKIDSSLVNPLANLPESIAASMPNLAHRNLLRGKSMGLPSGQDVARKMGIAVIPDDKLKVGKANEDGQTENPTIGSLHKAFRGKAPLWYYILAESQQAFKNNDTPITLGPVGSRIVGEVFVGLLLGDSYSYFNQDPEWSPLDALKKNGKFGIAEFIGATSK